VALRQFALLVTRDKIPPLERIPGILIAFICSLGLKIGHYLKGVIRKGLSELQDRLFQFINVIPFYRITVFAIRVVVAAMDGPISATLLNVPTVTIRIR
jgi:hypothetical protein